jgi:hypothetical protein
MRFVLISPGKAEPWDAPTNAGFEQVVIMARLEKLRADGHDYELVDGEALDAGQRADLYAQALAAVARSGNRYRIRQVFGSRRSGGGDHLGLGVPALLVFEDGAPVAVYPRQVGDGYETIRAYLDVR